MKKFFLPQITAVIAFVVIYVMTVQQYEQKVGLYQTRLRETMNHIHDLQHEIDPFHQKFSHGEKQDMKKDMHHGEHMHSHTEGIDVAESDWEPSVLVEVHTDPVSGYNIELRTDNFTFAPSKAGEGHTEGEGHAHLYVNGQKIARVYSNWFHIGELAPGEHEIKATLNANSHEDLMFGDVPIAHSAKITVDSE